MCLIGILGRLNLNQLVVWQLRTTGANVEGAHRAATSDGATRRVTDGSAGSDQGAFTKLRLRVGGATRRVTDGAAG